MSVDNSYSALNAEKSSFTLNAEKLHFSPGTSTAHHQTGAPLQSRCAFVIIGVTQTECVQNAQLIQVLENTAVSVITDWLAFGNEQTIHGGVASCTSDVFRREFWVGSLFPYIYNGS